MKQTQNEPPGLPPLWPSLLYLAFGVICFGLALIGAVRYSQDLAGFYYSPHILALTHLVTLGWITGNILGAIYLLAPMSLGVSLPAGKVDHAVFGLFAIGVSGMVSHFWIGNDAGMAWSAGCVYAALLFIAAKLWRALRKFRAPGYVLFHIGAAITNLLVAGGWGLTVAINKTRGFLPTSPSANVLAHAHMAAIGWAAMLVFGVAYRLLPMFVPGEPARGRLPWISGLMLEAGVLGLFVALLAQSAWSLAAGVVVCAGIALFLISAVRTVRKRKPAPPPEPPRPDFGLLHALFAFSCIAASSVAGLSLTRLPQTESTLQLALAYGFVGLVGFLGQIVIAMKPKIFSILAWYYAFTRHGGEKGVKIPRPVDMPVRTFQVFTFALWFVGVPLAAAGILFQSHTPIALGALSLLCSLLISTVHEVVILKLIFRSNVVE